MKKPTIILYFPTPFPYHRPWKGVPLSLLAISRTLDKEGYNIKIISRFLQINPENEIIKLAPKSICLGISAMTGFQIHDGLKMAKIFKKKYPEIPIVWGGWHPSILPLETLKNKYVDIVVRGQADESFPKLVQALEKKEPLSTIKGINYKIKDKIFSNPDVFPVNLNLLPPLPYHLIDVNKCLFGTEYGQKTIPYISSYGCPHRCAFCVEKIVNKQHWTALDGLKVVDEWQNLVKKYQVDSVAIYDSNFFVDEARIVTICSELINRKIKLKWGNANGRVRQLSQFKKSTWKLMEQSGCSMILTGAESGSQEALDFIDKDMNVDEIIKFTKLCHKHHIKILFSFLVGLPWSNNAQKNKQFINREFDSTFFLIDQLIKISPFNRFTYYVFLPYPGAPLFKRAVKLGLHYPKNLQAWSRYLMSPEDAFKESIKQKWISPSQIRQTAMLTQYIFGLLDQDSYTTLIGRINSPVLKIIFSISYKIALLIIKIRWRFKFFSFPLDYQLFILVHKYGKLI